MSNPRRTRMNLRGQPNPEFSQQIAEVPSQSQAPPQGPSINPGLYYPYPAGAVACPPSSFQSGGKRSMEFHTPTVQAKKIAQEEVVIDLSESEPEDEVREETGAAENDPKEMEPINPDEPRLEIVIEKQPDEDLSPEAEVLALLAMAIKKNKHKLRAIFYTMERDPNYVEEPKCEKVIDPGILEDAGTISVQHSDPADVHDDIFTEAPGSGASVEPEESEPVNIQEADSTTAQDQVSLAAVSVDEDFGSTMDMDMPLSEFEMPVLDHYPGFNLDPMADMVEEAAEPELIAQDLADLKDIKMNEAEQSKSSTLVPSDVKEMEMGEGHQVKLELKKENDPAPDQIPNQQLVVRRSPSPRFYPEMQDDVFNVETGSFLSWIIGRCKQDPLPKSSKMMVIGNFGARVSTGSLKLYPRYLDTYQLTFDSIETLRSLSTTGFVSKLVDLDLFKVTYFMEIPTGDVFEAKQFIQDLCRLKRLRPFLSKLDVIISLDSTVQTRGLPPTEVLSKIPLIAGINVIPFYRNAPEASGDIPASSSGTRLFELPD